MRRSARVRTALVSSFSIMVVTGCASPPIRDAADVVDAAWPCPDGWVRAEHGGCGPAVILCAPDGGSAPGACHDASVMTPSPVDEPDGGPGSTLYLLPDGAIAGAWREPGSTDGPPDSAWSPNLAPDGVAGACPPGWIRTTDGACDPAVRDDCAPGSTPLPGGACTRTAASDCPPTPYADLGSMGGPSTCST